MNALFPLHATTRDIIVHVAVTFLPEQSEPDRGRWFWAYHIRIENQGEQPVQLPRWILSIWSVASPSESTAASVSRTMAKAEPFQ